MNDHPYNFVTNIEPSEWTDAAQFGSKVRLGAHRLIKVVAAADDVTIGDAIAAAIVSFSELSNDQRAAVYARVPTGE